MGLLLRTGVWQKKENKPGRESTHLETGKSIVGLCAGGAEGGDIGEPIPPSVTKRGHLPYLTEIFTDTMRRIASKNGARIRLPRWTQRTPHKNKPTKNPQKKKTQKKRNHPPQLLNSPACIGGESAISKITPGHKKGEEGTLSPRPQKLSVPGGTRSPATGGMERHQDQPGGTVSKNSRDRTNLNAVVKKQMEAFEGEKGRFNSGGIGNAAIKRRRIGDGKCNRCGWDDRTGQR